MKKYPLILLHGYPLEHRMWYSTIAAVGSNAKVLAPDLPGFGKVPLLEDVKPSMEAYAAHVESLLTSLNYGKVILAGMSMGGYVALAFAEKYPGRLAGLGLISSQAEADTVEAKKARNETVEKLKKEGTGFVLEPMMARMFTPARAKDEDFRKYMEESIKAAGAEGLSWALKAMAVRPDRSNFLKNLDIPVLVLHGTEDKIVPAGKARDLAERCRNPILVEVKGVGHATPLEAPDAVAAGLVRLVATANEE